MVAHIFISGFVQGVGFRMFVKRHALEFGLTGWVRNLADNRVEAILQGSIADIEKMIPLCKKGAFLSEVKDVQVIWEETKVEFKNFEIISDFP